MKITSLGHCLTVDSKQCATTAIVLGEHILDIKILNNRIGYEGRRFRLK
jgi:hypothetical protein